MLIRFKNSDKMKQKVIFFFTFIKQIYVLNKRLDIYYIEQTAYLIKIVRLY